MENVRDYAGALSSDTKAYADYFNYMLNHGIYVAPSQFEAMFISRRALRRRYSEDDRRAAGRVRRKIPVIEKENTENGYIL